MTTTVYIIFAAVFLILCGVIILTPGCRHRKTIRQAKKVMKKIQGMEPGRMIAYLRNIHPNVFEEVVLLGFLDKGYRIRRNRRYTGDGGIDGRVYKKGTRYLVQDKRYSGYINRKDVDDFHTLCKKKRCKGFFVHTGKTGEASRETVREDATVRIISGDSLIRLLTHRKVVKND